MISDRDIEFLGSSKVGGSGGGGGGRSGQQAPVGIGDLQWEVVPNPGRIRKDRWLTEAGHCMWYGVHCKDIRSFFPPLPKTTPTKDPAQRRPP